MSKTPVKSPFGITPSPTKTVRPRSAASGSRSNHIDRVSFVPGVLVEYPSSDEFAVSSLKPDESNRARELNDFNISSSKFVALTQEELVFAYSGLVGKILKKINPVFIQKETRKNKGSAPFSEAVYLRETVYQIRAYQETEENCGDQNVTKTTTEFTRAVTNSTSEITKTENKQKVTLSLVSKVSSANNATSQSVDQRVSIERVDIVGVPGKKNVSLSSLIKGVMQKLEDNNFPPSVKLDSVFNELKDEHDSSSILGEVLWEVVKKYKNGGKWRSTPTYALYFLKKEIGMIYDVVLACENILEFPPNTGNLQDLYSLFHENASNLEKEIKDKEVQFRAGMYRALEALNKVESLQTQKNLSELVYAERFPVVGEFKSRMLTKEGLDFVLEDKTLSGYQADLLTQIEEVLLDKTSHSKVRGLLDNGMGKTFLSKIINRYQRALNDPQYRLLGTSSFKIININLSNRHRLATLENQESLEGMLVIVDEDYFINHQEKDLRLLVSKGARVVRFGASENYYTLIDDYYRIREKDEIGSTIREKEARIVELESRLEKMSEYEKIYNGFAESLPRVQYGVAVNEFDYERFLEAVNDACAITGRTVSEEKINKIKSKLKGYEGRGNATNYSGNRDKDNLIAQVVGEFLYDQNGADGRGVGDILRMANEKIAGGSSGIRREIATLKSSLQVLKSLHQVDEIKLRTREKYITEAEQRRQSVLRKIKDPSTAFSFSSSAVSDDWHEMVIRENNQQSGNSENKTQNIFPGLRILDNRGTRDKLSEVLSKTGKSVVAVTITNEEKTTTDEPQTVLYAKRVGSKVEFLKTTLDFTLGDGSREGLEYQKFFEGVDDSKSIMIYAGVDKEFVVGADFLGLSVLSDRDVQNVFLSKDSDEDIDLLKQMRGRNRGDNPDSVKLKITFDKTRVDKDLYSFADNLYKKSQQKDLKIRIFDLERKLKKYLKKEDLDQQTDNIERLASKFATSIALPGNESEEYSEDEYSKSDSYEDDDFEMAYDEDSASKLFDRINKEILQKRPQDALRIIMDKRKLNSFIIDLEKEGILNKSMFKNDSGGDDAIESFGDSLMKFRRDIRSYVFYSLVDNAFSNYENQDFLSAEQRSKGIKDSNDLLFRGFFPVIGNSLRDIRFLDDRDSLYEYHDNYDRYYFLDRMRDYIAAINLDGVSLIEEVGAKVDESFRHETDVEAMVRYTDEAESGVQKAIRDANEYRRLLEERDKELNAGSVGRRGSGSRKEGWRTDYGNKGQERESLNLTPRILEFIDDSDVKGREQGTRSSVAGRQLSHTPHLSTYQRPNQTNGSGDKIPSQDLPRGPSSRGGGRGNGPGGRFGNVVGGRGFGRGEHSGRGRQDSSTQSEPPFQKLANGLYLPQPRNHRDEQITKSKTDSTSRPRQRNLHQDQRVSFDPRISDEAHSDEHDHDNRDHSEEISRLRRQIERMESSLGTFGENIQQLMVGSGIGGEQVDMEGILGAIKQDLSLLRNDILQNISRDQSIDGRDNGSKSFEELEEVLSRVLEAVRSQSVDVTHQAEMFSGEISEFVKAFSGLIRENIALLANRIGDLELRMDRSQKSLITAIDRIDDLEESLEEIQKRERRRDESSAEEKESIEDLKRLIGDLKRSVSENSSDINNLERGVDENYKRVISRTGVIGEDLSEFRREVGDEFENLGRRINFVGESLSRERSIAGSDRESATRRISEMSAKIDRLSNADASTESALRELRSDFVALSQKITSQQQAANSHESSDAYLANQQLVKTALEQMSALSEIMASRMADGFSQRAKEQDLMIGQLLNLLKDRSRDNTSAEDRKQHEERVVHQEDRGENNEALKLMADLMRDIVSQRLSAIEKSMEEIRRQREGDDRVEPREEKVVSEPVIAASDNEHFRHLQSRNELLSAQNGAMEANLSDLRQQLSALHEKLEMVISKREESPNPSSRTGRHIVINVGSSKKGVRHDFEEDDSDHYSTDYSDDESEQTQQEYSKSLPKHRRYRQNFVEGGSLDISEFGDDMNLLGRTESGIYEGFDSASNDETEDLFDDQSDEEVRSEQDDAGSISFDENILTIADYEDLQRVLRENFAQIAKNDQFNAINQGAKKLLSSNKVLRALAKIHQAYVETESNYWELEDFSDICWDQSPVNRSHLTLTTGDKSVLAMLVLDEDERARVFKGPTNETEFDQEEIDEYLLKKIMAASCKLISDLGPKRSEILSDYELKVSYRDSSSDSESRSDTISEISDEETVAFSFMPKVLEQDKRKRTIVIVDDVETKGPTEQPKSWKLDLRDRSKDGGKIH